VWHKFISHLIDKRKAEKWDESGSYRVDDNVASRNYDESADYDLEDYKTSQNNAGDRADLRYVHYSQNNGHHYDKSCDYDLEGYDASRRNGNHQEVFPGGNRDYNSSLNNNEVGFSNDESMDYDLEDSDRSKYNSEYNRRLATEDAQVGKGCEGSDMLWLN